MIEEPQMFARQRTEEAKQLRKVNGDIGVSFSGSKEYTIRQDGMSNTITSTVQKDNLLMEPQVLSIGNRNPSGHGLGGEVYDTRGLAPTLCVNKCSGYTIANPVRLRETIAYKEMPNGNIRAYDPNTPDKRGISESQITNPENESPTITTAHTPKVIMKQKVQYRIRKLTPVETGRLMGMDDESIHIMLDPKDENGKPIISKSQAYKLHGNSIVVDVLFHIFRKLFIDTEPTEPRQLTLF